ncbi:DUF481 domain-containing protein [Aggregicoccus sp. 17bor-14]|uniref:DUF481 domain-containing protein n=1 Tax=Myxococcaceae TaxID=31 RepID=UPI00129C7C59|nr:MULTISPECIES: DUF481 domain-containing protein [Myxococcaceae]MBF5042291.1 DUF481 domain-containing protein [Simulacricoccus sp. 17bor-14]MRI88065.1 DUF481 domain-containing protein [Aggregicoccus sp. 17bor-14]
MLHTALLVAAALQAQAPAASTSKAAATPAADASAEAARAAASAAERAAAAAESSAASSARLAEAAEKLAASVEAQRAAGAAAAPAPAQGSPAAEATVPAVKPSPWKGTVGIGLISLTGNSSTLTFNSLASGEYKTEHYIASAKAYGVYGQSRLPEQAGSTGDTQTVALAAGAQLRGDRRFTQVVSGYVLVGAETDHVKSVEARGFGEAGTGILWWDETREGGGASALRTDLAFRVARETRFQYYPTRQHLDGVTLGAPRLGIAFRYALSERVAFREEAEILPNVIGDARVLANSTSKLSAGLTDSLALTASLLVQHDSKPAVGKRPTDTALSVGVELGL